MNNVPRPNLNQGVEAGLMGARFGNNRGNDMSSPMYMAKDQPTTTIQTNGRHTYQYTMRPTDNNWDSKWNNGTLLFVQRKSMLVHNVMSLEMLRYYMHQSAITKYTDEKAKKDLGDAGDEIMKMRARGRGFDYGFLADIESIQENLEFMGSAIGPTVPGTGTGTTETVESLRYTGDFKNVPFVDWGHCYVPNLWGDIVAGRDLYMICKPMPVQENYFSPSGERHAVPDAMKKGKCLIPDFQFTTHRPMDVCSLKELFDNKGEQPPPDCAQYINWEYDKKSGAITSGELRRGIVWKIGYSPHGEKGRNMGAFVPSTRKAERLQWCTNFNDLPMMELLLNVSRIRGY